MSNERSGIEPVRVWTALIGSMAPWLALSATLALGADAASVGALIAVAPLYWIFAGLPSMVAIVAGRTLRTRLAVTAAMSAVAVVAAIQVTTIEDGQAGLAIVLVPMVALPLAVVVWVGGAVVGRLRAKDAAGPVARARPSDRGAALIVDLLIIAAVEVVPLTMLSKAHAETAAAMIGVVLATVYTAAFVALAGRTPGHALLGLTVVDEATGELVPPARALSRSLVVVVESLAACTLLAPLALVEFVAVAISGRSLTDRLCRTAVVTGVC